MGKKRSNAPPGVNKLFAWVRRQSAKVKTFLAAAAMISAVVGLKILVNDYDHFFIASEIIHFAGILILIYKLTTLKTCSCLSSKTQELTATFLATRLCSSFFMEGDKDIHTILDFVTLLSTLWVIYMIRFKLKSTYIAKLDNMPLYYVVVPCAILVVLIHPYTQPARIGGILWAFAMYLESISVLPQLIMMKNIKTIEPFTAGYVFALGVARFLGCVHWMLQVYDSAGAYLTMIGSGYIWLLMELLSEFVQTFILADFCYYYVKSAVNGQVLVSLSLPV